MLSTGQPLSSSNRFWLGLVSLGTALDIATTAIGLHLGIPEDNPLMAWVLHAHGELPMYGLKLALVAGLFLVATRLQWRYRRTWPIFLAMSLPPILVFINNLVFIANASN